MRYARTRLEKDTKDRAYRIFLTEEIRTISESMAGAFGGGHIKMSLQDFFDRVDGTAERTAEKRTDKEIIKYVKDGLHKLADRK